MTRYNNIAFSLLINCLIYNIIIDYKKIYKTVYFETQVLLGNRQFKDIWDELRP
jgi:hypothetical protein